MNIPSEAKQKWQSLRQHGDVTDISNESGLSRSVLTAALDGEECTMDVFTAIQEFYNRRQEEINKLINPHQQAN